MNLQVFDKKVQRHKPTGAEDFYCPKREAGKGGISAGGLEEVG